MKLKFPITKHIRAELNKAGVVRFRNVRVHEASYTELRQLVEGGGYSHLSEEERHAITVGCCLTHPNHRHKHKFPWLAWGLVVLAVALMLMVGVKARAQSYAMNMNGQIGTSQIDVISFRDNSGVLIKSFAAPFTIKCGLNLTCSASGSVLTFAATGGGGGSSFYQTFKNAGVALTQRDTANFFSGITCADNAVTLVTDCQIDTSSAFNPNWAGNHTFNGSVNLAGGMKINGAAGVGKIPIGDGANFVPADPVVSGPDANGAAPAGNPVVTAGWDGTNVRRYKTDNSGILQIAGSVTLPPQPFLNTTDFTDVNAASPTRGDMVMASGATPKWSRFPVGTATQGLFGGTEPAWGTTTLLNGAFHSDTASGTPTKGDIIYANSSSLWADLASPTTTGRSQLVYIPTYQSVPAAPTLTVQNGGGTIAQNTTVFVQIKLKYPNGDTGPSIETSIVTSAGNGCTASCTVTVTLNASICQPTANGQTSTGCDVYDATASGGEKLQAASADCRNTAANCVIGTIAAGATITTNNNATIVGPVQWKQEAVRRACDFPGANAGIQIQNAINDLPIGSFGAGGTVDATCYGGTTQGITTQILLGDSTRTVTLIVDRATFFDVGATGGIDVFKIGAGSGIIGVGSNGNAFGNGGGFYLDGANISSLFTNANKTSLQQNMFIKGIFIASFGGVTVSNAIIWLQDLADTTLIQDVTVIGCTSICLEFQSVAGLVGPGDLSLRNVWIDGQSVTGARPVVIRPATGTGFAQISWFGGTINGPGAGQSNLDIDCLGTNACYNLLFSGVHMETAAAITDMVKVRDVFNVIFDNIDVAGTGTCTNMFNVSTSGQPTTAQFRGIRGGLCTNTLNDKGAPLPASPIGEYVSSGSSSFDNGFRWLTGNTFRVTSDFTTAANTNLQTITGLTFTVPALTPVNIPVHCSFLYSQATAVAAVSFGVQSATINPTNIMGRGTIYTSTTALTAGNLPTLATTTATAVVTATPTAITTIWNAEMDLMIENPSNASTNVINIMVKTATAGDAVTVKRGSFCKLF